MGYKNILLGDIPYLGLLKVTVKSKSFNPPPIAVDTTP